MTETLQVLDLSPLHEEELGEDEHKWLADLQQHVDASEHLVRLGEVVDEPETDHIVYRDPYGQWQAGRYIGDINFQGRRLEIRPRLKTKIIELWLQEALNLVIVPETATRADSQSFIAWLLSIAWCRAVDVASRHGPPSLRRERQHRGFHVRGHLDVRGTAQLRGRGLPHVASRTTARTLDNDIARTLVAAERTLTHHIGHDRWRTPRVKEVLPQLRAAVGARPRLPSQQSLERIRYSPITRPFKQAARLSWRIARRQGFVSGEHGRSEGLLLDVAELWELYVLNCVRRAFPALRIEHGTTLEESDFLLHSADHNRRLGRLKPDVLVRDSDSDGIAAVIDAKYKRLVNVWPERRDGVDRGDLYQLAAYIGRFDPNGAAVGALLYPRDPDQTQLANAETAGPWSAASGSTIHFRRLGITPDEAVDELADLFIRPGG